MGSGAGKREKEVQKKSGDAVRMQQVFRNKESSEEKEEEDFERAVTM